MHQTNEMNRKSLVLKREARCAAGVAVREYFMGEGECKLSLKGQTELKQIKNNSNSDSNNDNECLLNAKNTVKNNIT